MPTDADIRVHKILSGICSIKLLVQQCLDSFDELAQREICADATEQEQRSHFFTWKGDDPPRDALLYRLTIEAQNRLAMSPLSKREIIRRLGTSATQFYRLLDQENYQKSVDQLLSLLSVLDSDVDLVFRTKKSSRGQAA